MNKLIRYIKEKMKNPLIIFLSFLVGWASIVLGICIVTLSSIVLNILGVSLIIIGLILAILPIFFDDISFPNLSL